MTVVNEAPAAFRSSADRPGPSSTSSVPSRDIWSRRRLIGYMVRAEIKKRATDTVLGNVWWVLDPLITMLVYVLVMTVIFQRSTPDFPLFLLSRDGALQVVHGDGRGLHRARSPATSASSSRSSSPRSILPVTDALSQIVSFLFGMLVLGVVLLVFYTDHLTINLLWLPLIVVVQFAFLIGFTFLVGSVTVFYRDVGIVIGHLMRLLFWISPILWSFHAAAGRGAALKEAIGETGLRAAGATTRSRCCWTRTGPSSTAVSNEARRMSSSGRPRRRLTCPSSRSCSRSASSSPSSA